MAFGPVTVNWQIIYELSATRLSMSCQGTLKLKVTVKLVLPSCCELLVVDLLVYLLINVYASEHE